MLNNFLFEMGLPIGDGFAGCFFRDADKGQGTESLETVILFDEKNLLLGWGDLDVFRLGIDGSVLQPAEKFMVL